MLTMDVQHEFSSAANTVQQDNFIKHPTMDVPVCVNAGEFMHRVVHNF